MANNYLHFLDLINNIFLCLSRAAFESVVGSMLSVGFSEDEIVSVVALLAGVILIGDIVSSALAVLQE